MNSTKYPARLIRPCPAATRGTFASSFARGAFANPLWGAPRIHRELLKLGIDVGQTTVAKYMAKRRRPPSQGWKTFLRNHADAIASIDMFFGDLVIEVEGDKRLFNQYGVILVNPTKHPSVKKDLGQQFIDWLISAECAGYKINGQQLFYPDANDPNA
jgi:PBP superfamily domain